MLPTLLSLAAVPVLVHAHYNNIPGQKSSSTVVYEIPGASSTAAVHTTYSKEEDCEEETSTLIAYTSTADVETTSIVVSETQPTSTEEDCEEESTTEGSYPETSTHGGYTETTTGDSSAETTTPGPNAESSTEVYETPGASTTEEDDCDETETATSSYGASTTDDSSAETTTHGPGAESSTEVYETPGASTTDDSSAETTTPGPDSESSTQVYETPATTTEEDDCDETETATSSYGVETTSTAVETTETGSESSAVSTEAESTTETAGQTTETGSGSTAVSSVYQGTTSAPETVTSTYTTTNVYTITSCAPTVTNCPVGSVTTEVVTSYTTFCPATETETETEATSVSTLETVDVPYPGTTGGDNSGESATSTAPYETLTSTYTTTNVYTITSCAPTVTNCPVGSVTTEVVTSYTTYCPATETEGEATSVSTVETVDVPYPITTGDNSGESATSTTPYETYTSTYTTTNVYTITSCAPTVTNCPVGSVTTEVVTSYTTWCPATETEGEATSSHEAEQTTSVPSVESLTSTITSTHVYTVTACPPSVTNCPVGSVTTEVLTSYTAYHPGTTAPAETTGTTTLTKTSTLTKTKTRVHTISDCYGNESCHEGDVTTEVYTATEVTEVTTKETAATYTVHKTVGCSEGSYGCVEGSSSTTYLVTVQPSTVYPQPTGVSVPSTYQAPHVNATTSVGFYTSTAKVTYPVPVTTGGESSGSEPSTTPVTVPTGSAAAWNAPGFVAMALGLLAAVAI